MPTVTYVAVAVTVDDEGFFADPTLWTEEMASDIAREAGETLTDRHCTVIRFMRARVLGKASAVSVKELYQLFPKGPAKTAAKIAGIPKPRGCI